MTEEQRRAKARVVEWRRDPVKFVRECLHVEPDAWQLDVLTAAGVPGRKRIVMKACAGPGKTAVLAWLGWHRLACFAEKHEHPKGAAVSITSANLRDNLWAEMARWQNTSPFLLHSFEWSASRIAARDHKNTWFLSAKGWAKSADMETIGRTLSGQHSRFPFYLIDESGDIPPNMVKSAEQGLTSCEDGLIITAGNTTSQKGLLYDVSVTHRTEANGAKRWEVISITADPDSPKRTPRVPIEWAREQIALYGRENPWVMAYILGLFPPGSIDALLSSDDVEKAMNLHPRPETYSWAQKRLGTDVARFGDDRTVTFPRQGIVAFTPKVMRHARDSAVSVNIASSVMAKKMEWAQKTEWGGEEEILAFFDDTVGWAHGAVDVMRAAGHQVYAIQFNGPANDPRYFNLRAEMWMKMADWVKAGGSLPNIPELIAELTSPTYYFHNGKFQIESKDQVKKRLGRSPDLADALALTFSIPDMPGGMTKLPGMGQNKVPQNYDPYAVI
jgi:phage terminase large subunit